MKIEFDLPKELCENLVVAGAIVTCIVAIAYFVTDCQKNQDKYKAMTPAEIKAEATNNPAK